MRKLLSSLFLLPLFGFSQNLVPNPSFEEYSACPNDLGQVERAEGWFSANLTPDYFNACSNEEASIPNNYWGFQVPLSGSAYMGLTAYQEPNVREVIGVELDNPLSVGTKYFVQFYTSLYNRELNLCASNNLGVSFSTEMFESSTNPTPIGNQSLVYSSIVIQDTSNWVEISGSFVADSAYRYMYVGNLFDDLSTVHVEIDPLGSRAYYYIDEVCLSVDSLTCTGVTNVSSFAPSSPITVYPSPFDDYIMIDGVSDLADSRVEVFDLNGRMIQTHFNSTSRRVSFIGTNLPTGMYILKLSTSKISIVKRIIHKQNP